MIQNKLQVFVTRFAVAQISFLLTSPVGRLGTVQPCSILFVILKKHNCLRYVGARDFFSAVFGFC